MKTSSQKSISIIYLCHKVRLLYVIFITYYGLFAFYKKFSESNYARKRIEENTMKKICKEEIIFCELSHYETPDVEIISMQSDVLTNGLSTDVGQSDIWGEL